MLRRRRTATPILNGATLLSGANARAAPNSCGGTPYAPLQTLVELLKPPRRVRWERAPFRATRARAPKFGTGSKGREASVHNSQMALHNGRTPLDTRHIVPRVTAFEASAGLASSPLLAHRSPSESGHDSRHADHDSYAMKRSTRDGRAPDGGRRWRRWVRAARSVVRHPAGEGRARDRPGWLCGCGSRCAGKSTRSAHETELEARAGEDSAIGLCVSRARSGLMTTGTA